MSMVRARRYAEIHPRGSSAAAPAIDSHFSSPDPLASASDVVAPIEPDAEAIGHGRLPPEWLPSVLTADELARLLRINRKTVYAGFKAGDIPGGKRIGGTIRFSRDAVLRWLSEGQVPRSSRGSR